MDDADRAQLNVERELAASLAEAQARFLKQLQRWQAENNGKPVARSCAEWHAATGLDPETLTRVRQSLRLGGRLVIESREAWFFSSPAPAGLGDV